MPGVRSRKTRATSWTSYQLETTRRDDLELSFLLRTWFRDFPTICYEEDHFTPQPDYSVRRYLRLRAGIAERWHFRLPARFGEIGWDVDGFPVNRHTCLIQERINALHLAGALRRLEASPQRRVLEVGGGAGELAYGLCQAMPGLTWYDCDLLPSLAFNAAHLAVLLPEKRHVVYVGDIPLSAEIDPALVIRSPAEAAAIEDAVVNVPHFLLGELAPHLHLSLALNFWSFAEMPATAVAAYARLIAGCLTEDGLLVEQNGNFAHRGGADVRSILPDHFPHHLEVEGLFRMSRGAPALANPVHVWSPHAPIEAGLSRFDHAELRRLIASFDDRGDDPDLQFSPAAWDTLDKIQAARQQAAGQKTRRKTARAAPHHSDDSLSISAT